MNDTPSAASRNSRLPIATWRGIVPTVGQSLARWTWWLALGASLAALALALLAQHLGDMQPCAWCIIQRVVLMLVSVWALMGLGLMGPWPFQSPHPKHRSWLHPLLSWGLLVLAFAGSAAASWQWLVASQSTSCMLTPAEKALMALHLPQTWPALFEPRASCADASMPLLGLPWPLWSLMFFTGLAMLAVVTLRKAPKGLQTNARHKDADSAPPTGPA
jgi:disulfide bond formation protein DsbB